MTRVLLCKIVIMLVQQVSVSKLGLRLGGSKEKTQLVSNKFPEDRKSRRSSDASASDLSKSRLRTPSEMLEDVLHHKVEHMRNYQAILIRSLLALPIT
jgi:hypothetical protein